MRISGLSILSVILLIVISTPPLQAQEARTVASAPVPEQIVTAKKVFISNAGMDATSQATLRKLGDADLPYDSFYAAMKDWGRYELVPTPADADLVFEIGLNSPVSTYFKGMPSYVPQLSLVILDVKTHFTLWTMIEPLEGRWRKETIVKTFNSATTNLANYVKKLAAQPVIANGAAK